MKKYTVIPGDTYEIIARKQYGLETDAVRIRQANPGVDEPLTAGITITIPSKPDLPAISPSSVPATNDNEVSLIINDQVFSFWETMSITRSMDSIDTIEFTAPFEAGNEAFKDTFRPFSFQKIVVTVGGTPLFTGTMLTPVPTLDNERKMVTVGGYSLPGVLNDCSLPASAFPLEFNSQGLNDIAKTIAGYFGLGVEFSAQTGPVFDSVAVDPSKKAFQFLAELCQQRNFVMGTTPEGKLLIQRAIDKGSPVARLRQGEAPLTSVVPSFKPLDYYSSITGLQPATAGIGGSKHTAKNSRLEGVVRPWTFKANDTTGGDVKAAVDAKLGRMFANAVSYQIGVPSWRDSQNNLWEPNKTITLFAPDVMIYSEYELLIRSLTLAKTKESETVVHNLIIPESFKGEIPEKMPWD